jgi:hypothetical protein
MNQRGAVIPFALLLALLLGLVLRSSFFNSTEILKLKTDLRFYREHKERLIEAALLSPFDSQSKFHCLDSEDKSSRFPRVLSRCLSKKTLLNINYAASMP